MTINNNDVFGVYINKIEFLEDKITSYIPENEEDTDNKNLIITELKYLKSMFYAFIVDPENKKISETISYTDKLYDNLKEDLKF